MTQQEIDRAKAALPRWDQRTDEDKRIATELACREMLISCLTYESIEAFWHECPWRWGDKSYAEPFVRELGRERVEELVREQEKDFNEKATVHRDVYMDGEGVSYNAVYWRD